MEQDKMQEMRNNQIDKNLERLSELVQKNAESIQQLIRVSDKLELFLEQVKTNTTDLQTLKEDKIRKENLEQEIVQLKTEVKMLQKWRWLVLGGASVVAFLISIAQVWIRSFIGV